MPNYRKKKQSNSNNRNKNKNKNLNQNSNKSNTTSSSVKQELSEFESVGIRPNLPADVNFSCIETTTSARVLDIEKGVVVVGDDSSPLSNEEIDENACNVDIDTCSSDTKTVLTQQSNYSSSFCSSSSKKLTEIERKSERTVLDGDSTFGNSVITDTFQAGTGINSSKTGSAHTKDAAVPTAVRSATKSIETTRISEGSVDENRSDSGRIRDGSEITSESDDRGTKVIVHDIVKGSSVENQSIDHPLSQILSKEDHCPEVIVHKTFKKKSTKSTSSHLPVSTEEQTSQTIVHQISKEASPQSTTDDSKKVTLDSIPISKVIVHQVEESKTTSHIASKKKADQLPKVIAQQISKKKAVRSTTSSLHTDKNIDDNFVYDTLETRPSAKKSEESAKVIVHQISKEDSPQTDASKKVTFDPIPVIVHQISGEEIVQQTSSGSSSQSIEDDSRKVTFDPIPQDISKVIVHQISRKASSKQKISSKPTEVSDQSKKIKFNPIPQEISNVVVHQISGEDSTQQDSKDYSPQITAADSKKVTFDPLPQEISKVIVHQILKEDSVQEKTSLLPAVTENVDHIAKLVIHEAPHELSTQSVLSIGDDHRSKVIVHHILSEETIIPTPDSPQVSAEVKDRSTTVITEPILQGNSIGTASIEGNLYQNPIDAITQQPDSISTEEIGQSPKVIIIPILLESSAQTASSPLPTLTKSADLQNPIELLIQPTTAEEDDLSTTLISRSISPKPKPKEIVIPILVEDSTQTSPSAFPAAPEVIHYKTPPEVEEEYLPSTVIFEQISRDKFSEPKSLPQTTPTEEARSAAKVIVHPILQEESTQTESNPLQAKDHSNPPPTPPPRTAFPVCRSPKVIVHQINREGSAKPVFPFTPRSLEKLDHSSKRIANQILQDVTSELQTSFRAERANRTKQEVSSEPVRTSFPLLMKEKGPLRPGFFETNIFETESNPTNSKVIVCQISNEESQANQSNRDQRILSGSGSKKSSDDLQTKVYLPHTFPLHNKSYGTTPLTDLRSSVISSTLQTVEKDQRIQSDSGTKLASDDVELKAIDHSVTSTHAFPLSIRKKGHQTTPSDSTSKSKSTESEALPLHADKIDQRIQSDSGTKSTLDELESKVLFSGSLSHSFPLSTYKKKHETTPASTELESKVIVHQISLEKSNPTPLHTAKQDHRIQSDSGTKSFLDDLEPTTFAHPPNSNNTFPLSTHKKSHGASPVDTNLTSNDIESKAVIHQISQEESNSTESTYSSTSSTLNPVRKDQRVQSDSGTKSALDDLEPKAIIHQTSWEETKSSEAEFPVNLPHTFELSTHKEGYEATPFESVPTPECPESKDQRIQSDSGTKSVLDDFEPNLIAHPVCSTHIIPVLIHKESHGTTPDSSSTSVDFESGVIGQQISREESNFTESRSSSTSSSSHQTRKDQRIQSDSGTKLSLDDLEPNVFFSENLAHSFPLSTHKRIHEAIPTSKSLESKVIVHQISREESNSTQSSSSGTSLPTHREKKDQRIQSDSGTKTVSDDIEPKVIFSDNSPHSFPLSTNKEKYETTPTTKGLESKVIVHQISREELNSTQSSSSGTSLPSHREKKDQRIQSDSGTKTISDDLEPKVIFSDNSPHSFPLSTNKEKYEITPTTKGLESNVIVHQISREESNSTQSSSSGTSLPSHREKKDQRIQSDSGTKTISDDLEPKVIFPDNSPHSFPLSTNKEKYEITPTTKGLESNVIVHQISREESNSTQSSSSGISLPSHREKKDQRIQSDSGTKTVSDDLEPKVIFSDNSPHSFPLSTNKEKYETTPTTKGLESKVIVHRISREELNSTQSSSSGTSLPSHREKKDQRIQSDSGTKTISDDLEPKVIFSDNSPHSFPLLTHKRKHETIPTLKSLESKVIVHHISGVKSNSTQSSTTYPERKDQRIESDSGTKTALDDLEPNASAHRALGEVIEPPNTNFPANSPHSFLLSTHKKSHSVTPSSKDLESKVILHQILRKQTKSSHSSSSSSYELSTEEHDQRIQSDSGTKTALNDVFQSGSPLRSSNSFPLSVHRKDQATQFDSSKTLPDESSSADSNFPVSSGLSFPLSTEKERHPYQYTPKSLNLESKQIDLQALREESKLHQSSSTLTSPFALPVTADGKDQMIQSDSGTKSSSGDAPLTSFPLSTDKCDRSTNSDSNQSANLESKVIADQTLPEESHPSSSSSLSFPVSSKKVVHDIQYINKSTDLKAKDIDPQILPEESELRQSSSTLTSPFALTITPERKDQRIQSDTGSMVTINGLESKVIVHRISVEKSNSTQPSSSIASLPSHLERKDQRIQSDSGTKTVSDDLEPKVIFSGNSPHSFPLLTNMEKYEITPTTIGLESKVIVHQISIEESNSTQSSSSGISLPSHREKKDQRIQSDSGTKTVSDDLEPKGIFSDNSDNSPHSFPLSTNKEKYEITPTTKGLESKVIVHQISREEANSTQSSSSIASLPSYLERKDQRIQSDSGTKTASDDLEAKVIFSDNSPHSFPLSTHKRIHETIPTLKSLESKVIVHNISREKPNSTQSSTTHPERKDQRIESDSGTKTALDDLEPNASAHRALGEVIEPPNTNFPANSPHSFPLSTHKKSHSVTPPSKDLESKVIVHQILRKQTKSSHSSSSSSYELSAEKHDQRIQSDSGTKSPLNNVFQSNSSLRSSGLFPFSVHKKDQATQFDSSKTLPEESSSADSSFPVSSGLSFPLSTEKERHPYQYTPKSLNLESKQIDLQALREESKLHQSSSTLTSPFALPVTAEGEDQRIQSDSGTKSSSGDAPLTSFPLSTDKCDQSTKSDSNQSADLESKVIADQTLPEESHPSSSSSLSFPRSSEQVVHDIQYSSKSTDLQAKDIDPQILPEESELPQYSSTSERKDQRIQSDTGSKASIHGLESNVIADQITSSKLPSDLSPKVVDHQIPQDETISSSSSGESVVTAIQVKSPESVSPPVVEDQKEKVVVKEKSPRSSFFLTSLELASQTKADKSDSSDTETLRGGSETPSEHEEETVKEMSSLQQGGQASKVIVPDVISPKIMDHPIVREKTPPETGKVIIHSIVREIVTDKPLAYRVESPQPDRRMTIVKKSKSFDDDDIVIQEMSDNSSAGDTDNPPVISEAESETDTLEAIDEFPDTPINLRVLSVQTLPIDHEDDTMGPMSPKTAQDYKIRRQQNRVALESHFLPQFISPIFLDSIKEENSDQSDSERRSECSDRTDHAAQQGDLEDDVFLEGGPLAKKADAVFPKSNLDFSKKHKHVHTNVRPPKTTAIREEAPPPSVVEAKIIDQGSIEECCSSWSADLTPQSEDAEVVYIDSASSSVSDLLELDYSQGQPDDSIDVRIQTPTIDLESVNEMFAYRPCESNEPPQSTSPPPLPPVKEEKENLSENILLPPLTDRVETTNTLSSEITTTETPMEQKIPHDEIILEKIETMSETVAAAASADDDDRNYDDDVATAADRAQNSKANNLNSCDSAINEVVTNDTPSVAVGNIEKMENLREIVSASIQSELDTITDTDRDILKPNFKIGEPCSDHTFKCDTRTTTSSSTSSSSSTTTTTTTSTSTGTQILTLHDLSKTLGDTQHLNPLGSTSSALDRQESLDSHGSDQSQSTNQSQCTAINQGSLPHCDWNEIDTTTDTTYVSGSDTAGLASSENSSPITTGGGRSGDDTESPPIRKLRSLCTEALASMPYGEEVLEELATVAQNIGDMPYPLPQLPHIQDIQVSLRSDPEKSSVITLAQVPPTSTPVGQKFKSPPPPPVPEPPSKYDSWLGVQTESDPSVLVCLSPSQRTAVKDDSTADSLLDMHKKFVERRGYHEYTSKQVNEMNRDNSYETVKLSKTTSPPPPPLPPRPQQSQPQESKSNGNETETDINADDQNNHRLLAIIRDTHESQQQQHRHNHQQSENISRRTESGPNITNLTTNSTTTTTTNSGGGQEEFANSPSVSKQTQERFVSESNQSQSAHHEMQTGQTEHIIKVDREPILGLRFPTSDYFDSIFDGKNKRLSNIETVSSPGFCSQILNTQPKRYSNIETSSFESRKCIENGKILYDVSDSNRHTVREGEKPEDSSGLTSFPELRSKVNGSSSFPYISSIPNQVDSHRTQTGGSENIMSAFKLNTQTTAPPPPPVPAHRVEASPPAPPVPPLPPTLIDTTATTTTSKSTSKSESVINRNFNGETKETIFDDFRQHAKEATAGEQQQSTAGTKKSDVFDHEKLFKDFDELSNLLKDELESGKRRPPATLDGSEIPASVSDYNRVARESKIQSSHVSSSTQEHSRREQMKKLADEIDRTSAQRQQHRREMRIPIRIEKPTPTPTPPRSAPEILQQPRTYEIPVQMESGTQTQRTYEIPIRVENGTDTQRRSDHKTLHHQRSYEIPIRVEHQTGTRQRTRSEHQTDQRSNEVPIRVERPVEQPERFRRAESMFNISDTTPHRHMLHDDWMKYVGDLGSSENICKPFQREVEICYLGRRPNIRAPRLSASTSDLSSIQSYDTYGAYDVRRTTTTQTPRPQQPPRRRFLSTQSMIDTTPITPCVSSHRSPVAERRSSLPREIHDQQLKYISSKEHQLQLEFERLENERRQLIDEMNRAQISQRMNREAYRQRQLPPLTEDESFRQQMAEEWLHKVAEREERRLQKIIKISKINQDANFPTVPPRRVSSSDIGDEFLRRVKERRSKLCMPSDSDWESGAESQPVPRNDGNRSETEEPPMTVLEGQSEADIKHLPKHLREFAKLSSQVKEEHHEETTENTSCSATKKSSVVTTVKTSNATNTNNQQKNTQESSQSQSESLQQDAARVRDLEQLSQGKRQKLVTILRHKKSAESSSTGDCQPVAAGATTGAVTTGTNGGGVANSVKRRKQTRFLLTPNRRSWSESDLLREIDKELVLAKGFLYANESIQSSEMFAPKFKATAHQGSGVWTPKNQTPSSSRTNLNEFQPYNTTNACSDKISENRSSSACGLTQKGIPTPPPPPLWTPQPERKQFRPVHFESPKLQRRYVRQQSTPSEAPPPPWSYTNSQPFPGYQSQSCTNLSQKNKAIPWPPPTSQNGTTAIVDDSLVDDDGFAPTTSIAEKIRSFERSTSNCELHRPFVRHNPHEKPAILRPNEVIYSVKNEYMSEPETEYDKPKKMAQLSRRQYDGIGPTTKDGMPVVLRSEVKEPNQHEWYKRIFQTIHKQKNPGRYPYKSNGYMSEPEPNYDSDHSTVKYRTLERRRLQSTGTGTATGTGTGPSTGVLGHDNQDDTVYGTMPNPVKSGQGSYKVQPGRIEDYITGHSSVSEKEKKEWWDEVMDIFNGWLKDNDTLPRIFIDFANEVEQFQLDQQKLSPHYTEGNLSRALLKEQGYTSDSNLVFRKRDVPQQQSPLSPVEQKLVYKSVQAGGQPPLLGFRKPAPEKPKETEFEYLPITPTLTKIRVHSKEAMSKKSQTTHAAQRELICYPITNLSRPIDMFAPFPKNVPSFIPMNQPPLPPNRKSSRTRTTSMALKLSSSEVRRPTSRNSSRHEACFQTKDAMSPPPPKPTKYGTITLRKTVKRTEPLLRSKSAGAVVSLLSAAKEEKTKDGRVSRKQQTIRLSSCSPVRSASRVSTLRTSSRSPVAFGRSVSKERSFAEEKKRIEETMPSIRTDFTASTNILRDPKLKSPDQVKRAVRSYAYPMERSKSAPRVLSPAKPATSSYMSTYVVRRVASPSRKEVSAVRAGQTSVSTRSSVRTPVVVRSKSQSSKLTSTSKPMTKTSSTVSLARTNSTFSVDSTASKMKPIPKKPLTITRPSMRTETEKAKRKPVTISSSKSDSNVLRKIKESSEMKEKIVKAIPSQQKIVRSDNFFTNLFMRDVSPKNEPIHQASVHEKTRYWNTMSLPQKKLVSDSRHLSCQKYRSLSPPARPHYVEEYESVEHFQSDDEGSEFGDRSGRTEDLVWQYEQRSRSEPRAARPISDIARPQSPAPVFPREFSPTREIRVPQTREMRSPSRRRIQSFRGSQRGETGKVIRASSLSSADDRAKHSIYHCDDISHSANSLEYIERHSPSCRFKNSDRFVDLNRFYSTLERVGQLERATSATSLKPIRREGEAMDFEEWRRLRFHERAERELNYLVGRLKEDQKQKDFLFRPKDVEDVKWSGNKDLSLKSKDKSVEDLRENFEKKIHQEWLDESRRLELESRKDTYKPYWRGSSVADLASSMEIKYNPESGSFGVQKVKSEITSEKPLCLSSRLISTLSKDQVSKITEQLNEIYNASEPKTKPDVTEEYVITVDKQTPASALKVRCNSSISKEELIGPVLRRKEAHGKPAQSKTFDRLSQEVRKFESELSETEKRRLSQTFSREIQGKTRSGSPVMLARETRGAIAAENAKSTLPDIPHPPPLPKDLIETKKPAPAKPKRKAIEDLKKRTEDSSQEDSLKIETIATETLEKPEDTITKKIQYFEDRKFEEPAKTIYHAREDSSPDEDEVMRVIEENIKARAERFHHQELTSSVTDLKDLFGEKESSRINFPLPRPPPPPDETIYHETKQDQHRSTSLTVAASRDDSLENLEAIFRSRSISPMPTGTSYLHRVHTGEVRKIKDKFESLGRPKKKKHFFAISPLRKVRSDPELSNDGSKDTFKTIVREHEVGDVSWIAHKFEARNSAGRGRSRIRKPGSPIQRMPLRKEDRLMPHIDIISKTASLKQEMMKSRSPSPVRQQATLHAGEVERIRCIFETSPDRESLLGQPHLGASSPELRDISAHLTASWIAHKYPKPLDNDIRSPPPPQHEKSVSLPVKEAKRLERPYRSRSISPPKAKQKSVQVTSILKPRYDFFANQKFDPSIHRPKARYVPDSGDDALRKPLTTGKKTSAVKFKGRKLFRDEDGNEEHFGSSRIL